MSKKRDQLVETALALFSREGFHATGIDRILEAAGVAKMTLYKHFRSKEELILAALRLRDERWRNRFMRAVEKRAKDPRGRLLAMFDELGEWFADPGFCGCMFINASAEYAEPNNPIHAASAEHKRLTEKYVRGLAEQAGAVNPGELASQLCLLMEGATVMTQVCPDNQRGCAAATAKRAAELLIDHALAGGSAA
jgi:AcrR family transcriptional regulator